MASFINISSSLSTALFSSTRRTHLHLPIPSSSSSFNAHPKKNQSCCYRRFLLLQVKCLNEPRTDAVESEPPSKPLSSTASGPYFLSGISSYSWCAGLGGLGFLETGYLTYLKLTGAEAFCPLGGGSCGDVLNSNYAAVFGVPLSLIGMVAYGVVATVGLQLAAKDLPFGISESNGRSVLLGTTTSMATASAYFLYILSTQFPGASCSYCLVSAVLSFSLFFTTVKDMGWQEVREELGLQLCVAGLVFAALSSSYSAFRPPPASFGETYLPYSPTEIISRSSPLALKLAEHLHSVGAKMYGAFWCSHCLEQKQVFGSEAAKLLDYVECYPDGYKTGTELAKECKDVKIQGFPMWVINGQLLKGYQEFSDLAKASGFESAEFAQELADIAKASAEASTQPS